jgi:rhomboid family GlyGly-CTERM serine protease
MGLRQGDSRGSNLRSLTVWRPIFVVTILITAFGLLGDVGREALAYDRQAIAAGQIWRLVTAHLVHTGISHMLLNLAALWVVWYLVGTAIDGYGWLVVWIVSMMGIDIGLWLLEPDLEWYVGLSGVLHGLIAAGLVAGLRSMSVELWIVLFGLIGKLAYEQTFGPLPGSEATTGAAVIVSAHLYGAIAGALCGAVLAIRVPAAASI